MPVVRVANGVPIRVLPSAGIERETDPAESVDVILNMRMIASSNIEWIGWPTTREPLLIVQFKGGARYGYLGVSRQRAVAAAHHPSTGKYLNQRIKPHFKAVKLR